MLLGRNCFATASSGAPQVTPRAYADTRCPACGMVMPSALATSARMPIITNSVIPSASVPKARAIKLFFIVFCCCYPILHSAPAVVCCRFQGAVFLPAAKLRQNYQKRGTRRKNVFPCRPLSSKTREGTGYIVWRGNRQFPPPIYNNPISVIRRSMQYIITACSLLSFIRYIVVQSSEKT